MIDGAALVACVPLSLVFTEPFKIECLLMLGRREKIQPAMFTVKKKTTKNFCLILW